LCTAQATSSPDISENEAPEFDGATDVDANLSEPLKSNGGFKEQEQSLTFNFFLTGLEQHVQFLSEFIRKTEQKGCHRA
jgi:hypothetical protein